MEYVLLYFNYLKFYIYILKKIAGTKDIKYLRYNGITEKRKKFFLYLISRINIPIYISITIDANISTACV